VSLPGPPASTPASPDPAPAATRSRRRDWRTYVGGLGRVLISLGVLVLLFVVYQLWGTGLQEAQAQRDLKQQFSQVLSSTPSAPTPTTSAGGSAPTSVASPPTTAGAAPTTAAPTGTAAPASSAVPSPPSTTVPIALRPAIGNGDPVVHLRIPRIGLDKIVVEGVQLDDLKKGPGHYPSTPLPGEVGNAAIAGHRTTYGAPFSRIDELKPGDAIETTTYAGTYVYTVTGRKIVSPDDASSLAPTPSATLTLTSCNPKYSTAQRIIVQAVLDPTRSALPQMPPPITAPPVTARPQTPTSVAPAGAATSAGSPDNPVVDPTAPDATVPSVVATAFAQGWFSDDGAWAPLALWGVVLTVISVGAWLIGTRVLHRQWLAALLAIVPFLVALYFFYENVARLLPPNV
jgi:sortase A